MELVVRLGVPQADGAPLRAHLLAARRSTGETDERLEEAARALPATVEALWHAFEQLAGTRPSDGAITFGEIEAWQRLQGVRLSPWEVATIAAMDQAALAAGAEARKRAGSRA